MNKGTFYTILVASIVCLIGIAYAIWKEDSLPESQEGALMYYTCEEVKAYETLAAENDLDALHEIIQTHINEYPAEISMRLSSALAELDSLRDEAAFHNTDQSLYNSHFRSILRSIAYAELTQAKSNIDDSKKSNEAFHHAQHCLHDALLFSSPEEIEADTDLMHTLNQIRMEGLTASSLEKVMGRL